MSLMDAPTPDSATERHYTLRQTIPDLNQHTVSLHMTNDDDAIQEANRYKNNKWLVENGRYELSRGSTVIKVIYAGSHS